jgi:hypothetical protein
MPLVKIFSSIQKTSYEKFNYLLRNNFYPARAAYIFCKTEQLNSSWFVILLFFYTFIFRTITDYARLRSKNVIDKRQFWHILVPGSRIKYFKELYFL